jgi:hypothetical protein
MSNTYAFLAWDAAKLSNKVDSDVKNGDAESLKRLAQNVQRGVIVIKNWLEGADGELLFAHGDEGWGRVPGHRLEELAEIHSQMQEAWQDNISIGVGLDLSEAKIAMEVASKRGSGRILFYTDELKHEMEEGKEKKLGLLDSLTTGDLQKATPEDAPPSPASPQGGDAPAAATPNSPVASASEHSQGEVADAALANNPPMTGNLADQFHGLATQGEQQATQAQAQAQAAESEDGTEQLKAQIAQILVKVKQQAPVLEQLKQQAPDAYEAVTGVIQAMIAMAHQLMQQPGEEKHEQEQEQAQGQPPPQEGEEVAKSDPLAKGIKGAIAGLALGASTLMPAATTNTSFEDNNLPRTEMRYPPKPHHEVVDDLHPHLKAISFIESSGGKNLQHAVNSRGPYWTAHGELGIKPATAHDEWKKSKVLQARFPNLHDPKKFTRSFTQSQALYNAIANSHWSRLYDKFNRNAARTAYAWNQGEYSPYQENDYVRRFADLFADLKPPAVALAKNDDQLIPTKIKINGFGMDEDIAGHLPAKYAVLMPHAERAAAGIQGATYLLPNNLVLKLQYHGDEGRAEKHLRRIERLKNLKLSHLVPIEAMGHYGPHSKGHFTYEVLKRLRPPTYADGRWTGRHQEDKEEATRFRNDRTAVNAGLRSQGFNHVDLHGENIMHDTAGNPKAIDLEAIRSIPPPPEQPGQGQMFKADKVELEPENPVQIPGKLKKRSMKKQITIGKGPMPESQVPPHGQMHRNLPPGNLVTQHNGKREVSKFKVVHTNSEGKVGITDRETYSGMAAPDNPKEEGAQAARMGQPGPFRHPVSALNPHDEKQSGGQA